ncbi:MAG: hypothetical protein ACKVU1_06910 [bacterium]
MQAEHSSRARVVSVAVLFLAPLLVAANTHAELSTRPVTLGHGKTWPAISADGRWLAFGWTQANKQAGDVFMVDVTDPDTSKAPTPLARGKSRDHEPSWSPDGTRIAFFSGRSGDEDIWVYTLATEVYTQMTVSPWGTGYRAQEFGPRWSPDGSRIAFSSDRSGDDDIWWVPADGGEMVRVTKRTLPLSRDEDRFPSWSPDSKRIAYTSKSSGNWDLWIAVVDDTTIAPVQITADSTDEWLPAWSPNGRWIAFVTNRTGFQDIYVMPAEGGEAMQLTLNPGVDSEPCWSPDGKRLYYSSVRGGQNGIWVLDGLDTVLGANFADRAPRAPSRSQSVSTNRSPSQ